MIIKADYASIDSRLCELSSIVKEVRNEMEMMDEAVQNLGIFWESEASCEYALRINADMYVIRALLEKISLMIHSAREAVMRLDNAEVLVGNFIGEL